MGFVYIIRSTESEKFYIGWTKNSLESRLYHHLQSARFGADTHLSRAIRLYGQETFSIEPLLESEDTQILLDKEVEMIAQYKATELGWNINLGGDGRCDRPHTVETIEKMAETHRQTWATRTEEEKHAIGRKIREARKKNGTEGFRPDKVKLECPWCHRYLTEKSMPYHIECHEKGRM